MNDTMKLIRMKGLLQGNRAIANFVMMISIDKTLAALGWIIRFKTNLEYSCEGIKFER